MFKFSRHFSKAGIHIQGSFQSYLVFSNPLCSLRRTYQILLTPIYCSVKVHESFNSVKKKLYFQVKGAKNRRWFATFIRTTWRALRFPCARCEKYFTPRCNESAMPLYNRFLSLDCSLLEIEASTRTA
jgi:hypothetical protein